MSTAIAMRDTPTRRRAGRPRLIATLTTLSPREQILDAAGRLFATRGFAATSTREIAEKVGVRQASLYHYFGSKDEILADLLDLSLRPTLDQIDHLVALTTDDPAPATLYLLALIDIDTLVSAPHNIGLLGHLPDVLSSPAAKAYETGRVDLLDAYRRLTSATIDDAKSDDLDSDSLGELILQLVETVIGLRAAGRTVPSSTAHTIATSCLRLCGVKAEALRSARRTAQIRYDQLRAE